MSFVVNAALGLLFGVGLVVSGMADPAKVLNFLDLFGTWDPSLAFVMGGAVIRRLRRLSTGADTRQAGHRRRLPPANQK